MEPVGRPSSIEPAGRPFSDEEYDRRRRLVRDAMSREGIDALLVASPENIYWLCGLDHMGYFAYQVLIVPAEGTPILVTRAMERAIVADTVPNVVHVGYSDGTAPARPHTEHIERVLSDMARPTREPWQRAGVGTAAVEATCEALAEAGLSQKALGLEKRSTFLPYSAIAELLENLPDATVHDASGLVNDCRIVQSEEELELTRQAASISDAMMLSGIAAAGAGVNEREVMASIYDALFRRGGTYPGFVPLVRSGRTLVHEHATWCCVDLQRGEPLFLEMSGCVRRYHAPMGRLVHIGQASPTAVKMQEICHEAMQAAASRVRAGALAGDAYEAWQEVVDRSEIQGYRRHHCGYSVGIGYPPSWSGSGVPVGLRAGSDMKLRAGMVFHLMSWLLRSAGGDAFLSDTIVVTDDGCEFLTTASRDVIVR